MNQIQRDGDVSLISLKDYKCFYPISGTDKTDILNDISFIFRFRVYGKLKISNENDCEMLVK